VKPRRGFCDVGMFWSVEYYFDLLNVVDCGMF